MHSTDLGKIQLPALKEPATCSKNLGVFVQAVPIAGSTALYVMPWIMALLPASVQLVLDLCPPFSLSSGTRPVMGNENE